MRNKSLIALLAALLMSGCSTYDAVALPADLALLLFTDVYEDDNGRSRGFDDDHIRLWNAETSHCIYVEKNTRSLEGSLDRLFDEVEANQDYVELPTGEMYPVGRVEPRLPYEEGPYQTCAAKEDD